MNRICARQRLSFFQASCLIFGIILTIGCATIATVPERADAPGTVALCTAVENTKEAIHDWDPKRLNQASQRLQTAVPENETEAFYQHYWRGAALFHSVLILQSTSSTSDNTKQQTSVTREAIEALKAALEHRPQDGDSNAMLATLYGMKISEQPLSAIWIGPQLLKLRAAAKSSQSDNPRVNYLEGVGLLNRAGDSQDVSDALEKLLEAERLFEAEASVPKTVWDADWGRTSNQLFIGEAYEKLEQPDQAIIWFQRVMQATPASVRAREGYERCRQKMESM
ncbi:MAG: hypothetical protein JXR73_08785 [Candidatus Omnitrophica bacterium]|nr:hypothetical protein [Candidatus Omnitrophota bacterium]